MLTNDTTSETWKKKSLTYIYIYIKYTDTLLELQSPDMRYQKGLICNKSQRWPCALQALVGHIFTVKFLWSFWQEWASRFCTLCNFRKPTWGVMFYTLESYNDNFFSLCMPHTPTIFAWWISRNCVSNIYTLTSVKRSRLLNMWNIPSLVSKTLNEHSICEHYWLGAANNPSKNLYFGRES
jgi:hypothetical protein